MKIFILLMLLSTFALTEEVKCSCERFNKDHCERLQNYKKCGWLDDKCLNYRLYEYYKRQQELQQQELQQYQQSKLSKPESMYCKDLEKDKCKSTNGCAYYNQECIQFPGCSLFDTSHCSESSTQCHLQNSQCVEYKQCKHLIVQDECGKIEHLNGVAESCQWKDDKCSEKECEDAPKERFGNCAKYLNKCSDSIKNGEYVGCQKKTCNTYKGLTKLQCTNIITHEGKCDKSKSINICYGPGDCNGPAKSQEMCQQFGDNCFYNGKECLPLSQLKSCNEYSVDCDSNIGLEGQCKTGKIDSRNCYSKDCNERFCYQTSGCVDKNYCYLVLDRLTCNERNDCAYNNDSYCTSAYSDCTQYKGDELMCKDNTECKYIPHNKLKQKCEVITSEYYCLQNIQLDYLNCIWTNNQCEVAKRCRDLRDCSLFINCYQIEKIQHCVEQSVCEDYDISYCLFMNNNNCKEIDTLIYSSYHNQCVTKQCEDHQNEENCKINGCQFVKTQCKSKLTCESNLEKDFCTSDQNNVPCIWNESLSPKCQQFSSCESLQKQSIEECKSYSTHCTYITEKMYSYCSVNRRCFKQNDQCKSETSEKCGKKSSKVNGESECHLFTNCIDYEGTKFSDCQEWSDTCTTNGKNCTNLSDSCQEYQNEASCTINAARIRCDFVDARCKELTCTQQTEDCSTYQLCYMSDCNQQCYLAPSNNCNDTQETCNRKCISYKETCDMYKIKDDCYISQQNICFWNISKQQCEIIYDCFQAKYEEICDTTKCVWNQENKFCYELSCSQIGKPDCNQTIQGYQYTEQCIINNNGVCVVKIPRNDVECYIMSENLYYSDKYKQCVRCQMPKERVNPLKRELK